MLKRLILCVALWWSGPAVAGDVQVAVAANFTEPAKAIAQAFRTKTGHSVTMSFGPSGGFYSQVQHGAPFEVFLSADAERPTRLEAEGHGVAGTRFVYATGRLVLWSATPGLVDDREAVLSKGDFRHLAIAEPASAPYGEAAVETLKKMALYEKLSPKIVRGASIAQTYAFVQTGAAELGFVALSQVIHETGGSRWIVPQSLHAPIGQQAILLKPGAKDPAARAYMAFLRSPDAMKIIRDFGYEVVP